jgi:hypothetical protein
MNIEQGILNAEVGLPYANLHHSKFLVQYSVFILFYQCPIIN